MMTTTNRLSPLMTAWRWVRRAWRLARWTFFFFWVAFFLSGSTLPIGTPWYAVAAQVSAHQFDYLGWILKALGSKAAQNLWGVHPYMDEASRSALVRDYFADLSYVQSVERQIEALYLDPALSDPLAASAELRTERDALRASLRQRQMLAEAILEGQVAAVLVEEGFGWWGQLLPPISMHFTQVPNLLIVSPRDEIRFDISINLNPLSVDEKAALEDEIDRAHDVSSLIVPLGGIALFPAMILETSNLTWAIETFAHEWAHHYLFFFPLGMFYDFAGETRMINETVADLFGEEIAGRVLERYYPTPASSAQAQWVSDSAPVSAPFDFGAAMHETRIRVDALLAEGRVEDAEAYMAQRQALFVANGYGIRKLNQAFFAFYGGYQAGGVAGVAGDDPIGPVVAEIRQLSPSLHDFMVVMRGITTRDQLLALRDELRSAPASP